MNLFYIAFLILVVGVVYVLHNQNIITIPQISIPLILTPSATTPSAVTPNTPTTGRQSAAIPSTVTPSTTTPSTATPSTVTPNTTTPSAATPSTVTPNTTTPSAATPNAVTPNTATPTTITPSAATPNTATPNTVTPTTITPSAVTPNTVTPNTATQNTATQNTATPSTSTPTDISSRQSEDCIGTWQNVGTCNIDRCDPTNIGRGLGKQTQEFLVQKYSTNEGKPCPGPTREVDCSLNNYIDCVQCGGLAGNYTEGTSCKNIKSCEGTMGIGQKENPWSANTLLVLPNCAIPANKYVSCTENNFPACSCSYVYDQSKYTDCKEKNIFCEDNTAVCTADYTKTNELPGGICPIPNNIFRNTNEPLCACQVQRSYGDWLYTNPRCDPSSRTTFIADNKYRTVTITKINGYIGCSFDKLSNETIFDSSTNILNGKLNNNNNKFQFGSTNDFIGATFQTLQTENNINLPDNIQCKCQGVYNEWSNWSNWNNDTTCPIPTDYNIDDAAFNITQTRTRNRTFNISNTNSLFSNYSCSEEADVYTKQIETQNYTCPRHCSSSWSNWTVCNTACPGNAPTNNGTSTQTSTGTQSTQTATYTIHKTHLGIGTTCTNINGDTKIQSCYTEVPCPLDCSWNFSDWNACAATCDGINPSRTGTRTRTYTVTRPAVNEGSCDLPSPEHLSQICTKTDCPVDCVGDWGAWTACAATCDGINASRTGTRTRTYIVTTVAINGGAVCPIANDTIETDSTCQKTDCPVDCVGDWGVWNACAATCDGINASRIGTRTRTYRVTRPVSNRGAVCPIPNDTTETDSTCQKTDCHVDCVGDWGTWTACAATCDGINTTYIIRISRRARTYIIIKL